MVRAICIHKRRCEDRRDLPVVCRTPNITVVPIPTICSKDEDAPRNEYLTKGEYEYLTKESTSILQKEGTSC